MIVEKDKVVSIQYSATDETGAVVDSNMDVEPLEYLHGYGNILENLEKELTGLEMSQEKQVLLVPEQAYGDFDPELVFEVSRQQFPQGAENIELGNVVQSSDGQQLMVTDIDGDKIILDGNHPLAGRTLHFSVIIKNIREATSEELAHGHAHMHESDDHCGPDCGCHH
ncbi:MAG: peptidylprolyl isomerase [Sphingobacteriales bacterium]|nr:peptidylprolyl isomerase [Sphingobacteriales bacterium]OJY91131.1 MAG: hypothetical protein BGP14_07045 [Sphingobacteriales bacterium 44-15]